jgi:hypothetical protein
MLGRRNRVGRYFDLAVCTVGECATVPVVDERIHCQSVPARCVNELVRDGPSSATLMAVVAKGRACGHPQVGSRRWPGRLTSFLPGSSLSTALSIT